VGRSTCSPTAAGLQSTSPVPNQMTYSATINQHRPQEIVATNNEAPVSNQMGHSQSEYRACSTEAQCTELSQEILHKQQAQSKNSVYEGRQREKCNVWSDESLMRDSESQCSQEANGAQISSTERCLDPNNGPYYQTEVNSMSSPTDLHVKDLTRSKMENLKHGNPPGFCQPAVARSQRSSEYHTGLRSEVSSKQEGKIECRELPHGFSNPCILPWPPNQQGIHSVSRAGTVGRVGTAPSLLDLQNSFSKSEAHRNFNNSITRAAVNVRDNVVSGKKHDYFGINCNTIRG